ncbi:hypothetical protein ELQ92_00550 [Labedella populi]|uniref:ATPase BadF/BadG/BcrA/BcrD type domain-containing protein n=1 Tax=Labedella populi TaxID=2498850 RepID=A0A3S5CPH1_9MICO|nr:hypothetical protein ELQ92_00550 [Labedella populi]
MIGIDVGGTKTHVRAEDGDVAARDRTVPTRDWQQGRGLDHQDSIRSLLSIVRTLGDDDGTAALVVGAHGCDTPAQIEAFHAALSAQRPGPVLVTNDAALVGPAAGVTHAIGVIAGTGSIVVGATMDGSPIAVGGHGWMIADPGSAPALTREAVRAVIRRADEGGEPDALGRALLSHFAAPGVNELAWMFMSTATMHRWAEGARLVFDAAEQGSKDALETIEAAAAELAHHVTLLLDRGAVADAVVAAGGVVTNQPLLARALETELVLAGVTQPFRVLDHPPVAGAIALARDLRDGTGGITRATAPSTPGRTTQPHPR